MTIAQQIFLLFYAILYGALFTLSDRWKPFIFESGKEGNARYLLSVILFGILPILYFYIAFSILARTQTAITGSWQGFLRFLLLFFLVTPIYGFYCIWGGIVLLKRDLFYANSTWDFIVHRNPLEGTTQRTAVKALVIGVILVVGPLLTLYCFFRP